MNVDSSYSSIFALRARYVKAQAEQAGGERASSAAEAAPVEEADKLQQAVEKKQAAPARRDAELTEEEKQQVEKLQKRDREVRAHEQAHLSAAGGYARGGASYTFETGPDGRRYATGGEVPIDTSEVPDDPQATIRKMAIIRKAALAPQNPSGADRNIAASAAMKSAQAMREMLQDESGNPTEEPSGGAQQSELNDEQQNSTNIWQTRRALVAYSQAAYAAA
ncbi:MAG TPA: hypothetical protein ENJ29_04935 [Bacteroidetes bacterium]|nr:hypothetical protein [Bacteroidota bacterium]